MNLWNHDEPLDQSQPLRWAQVRQLEAYIDGLMDAADAARASRWDYDFSSVGAYRASVEPLRQHLCERLGYPPPGEPADAEPRWEQIHETDLVRIFRVHVPVRRGLDCYGLYFQRLGLPEPRPLLVCKHGGGGYPELASNFETPGNYGHMMERAVEAGYSVWAPYTVYPDAWEGLPRSQRRKSLHFKATLAGTTLSGIELFKLSASLDAIAARPEIDADRIGMVGLSYGGYFTLFATALDERIKAACSSCYFNDRREVLVRKIDDDAFFDWHLWNLLGELADEQLVALVCPRPLVLEVGTRDELFLVDGARRAFELAKAPYERLGVGDRVHLEVTDGGHEFHGVKALDVINATLRPDA